MLFFLARFETSENVIKSNKGERGNKLIRRVWRGFEWWRLCVCVCVLSQNRNQWIKPMVYLINYRSLSELLLPALCLGPFILAVKYLSYFLMFYGKLFPRWVKKKLLISAIFAICVEFPRCLDVFYNFYVSCKYFIRLADFRRVS